MAVQRCDCTEGPSAKFQDERYGKNMRIMNENQAKTKVKCTVCGKMHSIK